ncbi:MAG: serine hydrolase [Planctomycetaceae bacterium]
MKNCVLLVMWLVALCASGPSFAQVETTPAQSQVLSVPVGSAGQDVDVEAIRSAISEARVRWGVPGLAVSIVRDGQVIFSEGFGVRELGREELVDGDTLFAIASNSKAFTSAALAILEEDGVLDLSDRVQKYLPWLQLYDPWVSSELRIDDLLCHRSGLGTFSGDLLWWGTPYSPEEVLRRARHLKPEGQFRASYGYSNLMFLAAGEVIAKASGNSWSDFVAQRILKPVGMNRTLASVSALQSTSNIATPHKPTPESVTPIPWVNWDTMAAAGGIISSTNDMAKWLIVQLNRGELPDGTSLFSRRSSDRMWKVHNVMSVSSGYQKRFPSTHFRGYGLGWVLSDYKGRMTVSHGGGYDGMYSHVLMVPDENLGIVVLTNSMTGISPAIANTVMDRYLGGSQREWLTEDLVTDRKGRLDFHDRIEKTVAATVTGTQPSRSLDAYAGEFRCPLYGDASVTKEGQGLVLRLLPNEHLIADLEHIQFDTFRIRWRNQFAWFGDGTIQFVPDAKQVFQQLRLDVPNDDLWFYELDFRRIGSREDE